MWTWIIICILAATARGQPYNEAPMLAAQVQAGELPPVHERLPPEPVVVDPVDSIGKYGGTWRMLTVHWDAMQMHGAMGYEPLVRWDRSGRKVVPGLAKRWDVLDGGRTYRFHLRQGIRWSDGHPFTSDDFVFWYENMALDREVYPFMPIFLNRGGNTISLSAPDKYTVDLHCERPHGLLLEILAFRGHYFFLPKHYLMQFHARYTDRDELQKRAEAAGYSVWGDYFMEMRNYNKNPEMPTIRAFKLKHPPPAPRVVAERNPYYWKVDPEGNQLPYIDTIAHTFVQNDKIVNLKAMTGAVDMQVPYIDPTNYTLFMENRQKGGYRVLVDPSPMTYCMFVNANSKDLHMRPILRDKRFRIALSIAIDRPELIEFMFSGLAEPVRGVASHYDPYHEPWMDKKWADHDPQKAERLLDEIELRRHDGGMRRMPDGGRFRQIVDVYPSPEGAMLELWQLVVDYWKTVGLDFVVKTAARDVSILQSRNGNTNFWCNNRKGMHWAVQPLHHLPVHSASAFAPLYGRYFATRGKSGIAPSPEYQQMLDWYTELIETVGDPGRKMDLGRRILAQWAEQCYTIDIARTMKLAIVSNRFRNMPDQVIHSFQVMSPGYIGIEQFYLDDED